LFDGVAILYSQLPLIKENKKMELISVTDKKEYSIIITFTNSLTSTEIRPELIQFFNLIYKRSLYHLKLQRIGRSFYNLKHAIEIKGLL
jgi:hypothetical protein